MVPPDLKSLIRMWKNLKQLKSGGKYNNSLRFCDIDVDHAFS
jgi:hypothetical protein